jgi:hypothetical protein
MHRGAGCLETVMRACFSSHASRGYFPPQIFAVQYRPLLAAIQLVWLSINNPNPTSYDPLLLQKRFMLSVLAKYK